MDVIIEINSNRSQFSEYIGKLQNNQSVSRSKKTNNNNLARSKSKSNSSTINTGTIVDLPVINGIEMNNFYSMDLGSSISSKTFADDNSNKNRAMSAKKCSDVYKEVIASLINDNLLAYSKYYEAYLQSNPNNLEEISNSDDLDSFYQTNTLGSKSRPFSRSSSVTNIRSALKTAKKRVSTGNKQATFSNSIDTYSKSRLSIVTPNFSNNSFSTPQRRAASVVLDVKQKKPENKFRSTDLLFAGYEKPEKVKSEKGLNEFLLEEDEFITIKDLKKFKEVSPFYSIKVYNRDDRNELEIAKKDLYERYGKYELKKKTPTKEKVIGPRLSLHSGTCTQHV